MQLAVKSGTFETDLTRDRRDTAQDPDRSLGRVVSCDGSRATIASTVAGIARLGPESWTVGRMISINLGRTRIVGLVYEMSAVNAVWDEGADNAIHVQVELLGEVTESADGRTSFQSGISTYPPIGAVAHRIRAGDLALVHDLGTRKAVAIGTLTQDPSIPATICIDDMLARHFALVGTTGVGKSSAVSLLLRRAVAARPRLRVLILDPHNEYASAFPDRALAIDAEALDLPFWMFKLEEFAEVVFRGRAAFEEENDILREVVLGARERYRSGTARNAMRDLNSTLLKRPLDVGLGRREEGTTTAGDMPTPYRIVDAIAIIDEFIGLHEKRWPHASLRSLKVRLETLHNDPRYQFMFARANMMETMAPVLSQIFRLPHHGRPITVFQLGGLPSEVVDAVASVLARLSFDLAWASQGTYEILLLCEEAHRYVPADPALGFQPTRQAIARIAKEGRKYGAYLGVVTQRPGELDPTILSQCSTIFAMRLANEVDQQIIRSAISDASASTLKFLSSVGNREAIAFGEGVATTMRMRFAELAPHELPSMDVVTGADGRREPGLDDMVRRMRG
ncbi:MULTISPECIES: ATP-binding protein [Hyphomicrobiales]|uniref:ATP-binding protein n=1 Tax=Bosea massiliensis TaxID=151419 RepID=A0ABW0P406_9HYPH|nr:ATP-binding protein [Bradyrhizobium sp. CCH1-B1]